MPATKRDYKISVICMLILFVSFLVVALFGYFYKPLEIHEYGVVVDISSSDIEFNLYRWKNRKTIIATAQVKKKYTISCDVNIHKKPFDIEKLRESLFQCVKYVIAHIENYELYNATIFIYGTELTRLVCEKDPEKCNIVFGTVAEVIGAFEMNVMMDNIKPLTGVEEALFGWISVNYYFKNIQNGRKGKKSYGGLDIKNYSVLLSQEMEAPFIATAEKYNSVPYTLYGTNFDIVGIDMMCYGIRQIYDRVLLNMFKASTSWSSTLVHPCHVKGYAVDVAPSSLASLCITEIPPSLKKLYHVTGTWDEAECKKLILDTLDKYDEKNKVLKDVKTEVLTDANRTFFGFSRIAEIAQMVDFSRVNYEEFLSEGIEVCGKGTNVSFADFCFDIIYMGVLIDELGIATKDVLVGNKEKIETMTGAMVYHSRDIKPRRAGCAIGNYGFMFVVFSLLVFGGLGIFLIRKTSKLNKDTIV